MSVRHSRPAVPPSNDPRRNGFSGALLALALAAGLAACERSDPAEPGAQAPSEPARPLASSASTGSVPCSTRYQAWALGLHAAKGSMTALSPSTCSALTSSSSVTFDLLYTFGQNTNTGINSHFIYLTEVFNDGRVRNNLLGEFVRADLDTYPVVKTFTPTSSHERLIISVGHGELLAETQPGEGNNHREIVLHFFRHIPSPSVGAELDGQTVVISWSLNHHYLVHRLERRPEGSGAWETLGDVVEPASTTHSLSDDPGPGTWVYRVTSYFDPGRYPDIGANIENLQVIANALGSEEAAFDTLFKAQAEDTVTVPDTLSAEILGPEFVPPDTECSWVANVNGGLPPYSYEWRKESRDLLTGAKSTVVSTSSTYTGNTGSTSHTLRLTVGDAAGQSDSDEIFVSVTSSAPAICFSA